MIYNIKTQENSDYDSFPIEWQSYATERKHIIIKPPKIVNTLAGIFIMGLTGAILYIGENRHKTVAQNGAQPSFDLLATSIRILQ